MHVDQYALNAPLRQRWRAVGRVPAVRAKARPAAVRIVNDTGFPYTGY
jgi:hypothetical protein